jgi:hypothetical protein
VTAVASHLVSHLTYLLNKSQDKSGSCPLSTPRAAPAPGDFTGRKDEVHFASVFPAPGAAGGIGAVLGQVAADSKPNETPAAREPLRALADPAGAVSTTDAPRARRDTAQAAPARHADHATTVKANTAALHSQLKEPPWKDVPAFSAVAKDHQGRGLAPRPGHRPAAPDGHADIAAANRHHARAPPRFINDKRDFSRVPGQRGASNPPDSAWRPALIRSSR